MDVEGFIRKINDVDIEIEARLKNIEELEAIKDSTEKEVNIKLQNQNNEIVKSLESQNKLNNIMLRNKTLRERIHSIDESVKNKAASISEETQHFFSLLGIKATIKEFEEDNDSLEIKLQFSEGTDHFVSLFYDVETDDYDLIDIHPKHDKIDEIRIFLRRSGDIFGFLSNYKKYLEKLTQHKT